MNATCNDLDRIFERGTPDQWAALEAHASTCESCAEQLRAWKALSVAAEQLRDYTESPLLWPRIRRALAEQGDRTAPRESRWKWALFQRHVALSWQTATATAMVLVLAFSAVWLYVRIQTEHAPPSADLLKHKALAEVERSESAYVHAIDKLAAQAEPQLDNLETPLIANYREKLLVLDSAIADLRAQAGQNPSNAHLRYQLLAMYQEKQRTLQEILEEKR